MAFVVGPDWGGMAHAVCVIERESGAVADRFAVAHDAAGLRDLQSRLARRGMPDELPIAVERPSGLIVDALVAAGHPVVAIHPNIVKASRPRYRAAGGKSDGGDAHLLADLLRADGHRFHPLSHISDEIRSLRALVRGRDDLVTTRVGLANQLRSLLESFSPGAAAIFADVDSPIALAFLAKYPCPEAARARAPNVSPASSPSTATAGAAARKSCSPACAPRPRASPVTPSQGRNGSRPRRSWRRSCVRSSISPPLAIVLGPMADNGSPAMPSPSSPTDPSS